VVEKKRSEQAGEKRATVLASGGEAIAGNTNASPVREELNRSQITDETPLDLPGISNFGQLYEVYGRYSDRHFAKRVFGGAAFRQLLEKGADEKWLRTVCEEVELMKSDHKFSVSSRPRFASFQGALRKAIRAGVELVELLPRGIHFGEVRHEIRKCLEVMRQCKNSLDVLTRSPRLEPSEPRRGAPPDPAAEHFRWQMQHYPWNSRPADRVFVELYKDLTGRNIQVASFRRARRRDRRRSADGRSSGSSALGGQK
jgi:hypothetical protein